MDSMKAAAAPHVVMLPFPQKSHINPMMNLAQHLACLHVRVTFVYYGRPPSAEMRKKILEHLSQFSGSGYIRVVIVPKCKAGLCEQYTSDEERGVNAMVLKESLSAMEKEMVSLIEEAKGSEHPVTCLVSDTLFGSWPQDVANKFGIPRADFSTFTATNYALCSNLSLLLSRCQSACHSRSDDVQPPDEVERLVSLCGAGVAPTLRVKDLPSYFFEGNRTPAESLLTDSVCGYDRGKDAKWVLIHSCYELEKGVIDALHADKVRVHAIGPMLPPSAAISHEKSSVLQPEHSDECLRWLDAQIGRSSVLYIALGTAGRSWSPTEIQAIALGVEDSQLPFLWDLRPDTLVDGNTMSVMDILPEGFLARTKDRSLVVSRAPQLAILAHPSVGGFLTQCEWNSIQEGIYYGVPMVGIAGFAEKTTNLRLMTHEWKVGIGIEACRVQKEDVEKAVRALMSQQTGDEMRERVRELMGVVQHSKSVGTSKRNLDAFVRDLWEYAANKGTGHEDARSRSVT